MVIEAKCTRMDATTESESGSCNSIATKPIKDENIKKNITIEPSIVHKYDITITFKETNEAQNYNQGKKFSGVLGVTEFKLPAPVYCTFDGEMVQGAEYVNGQYTYRYMQEGNSSESGLAWRDISDDGWGVQFTDKTITGPVTSKLCTYINNKPVTSMSYMFSRSAATTLNLSNFDTSKVTNISNMFSNSAATTIDLSSFNTSNVTNMWAMFFDSKATTLDLSSFDTSNVTDMSWMFSDCSNLKTIYASNKFNTNAVSSSNNMFTGTTNLVGGAGTTYNSSYVNKTYARIDGGASLPGYFTLK